MQTKDMQIEPVITVREVFEDANTYVEILKAAQDHLWDGRGKFLPGNKFFNLFSAVIWVKYPWKEKKILYWWIFDMLEEKSFSSWLEDNNEGVKFSFHEIQHYQTLWLYQLIKYLEEKCNSHGS